MREVVYFVTTTYSFCLSRFCSYIAICKYIMYILWYARCSHTIADIFCLLFGVSDCAGHMELPPDCATEGYSACAALCTNFLHHGTPDSALPLPVSSCSAEYSTSARWHCQESTCQVYLHIHYHTCIYVCTYNACTGVWFSKRRRLVTEGLMLTAVDLSIQPEHTAWAYSLCNSLKSHLSLWP